MTNKNEMRKQQQLLFDRLEGQRKEDFFVSFFESEVASLLREMRKEKHLTQGDVAKRSGLKQGNVSKIENLEKTPTLTTIGKYLFALDYSINEIEELTSKIVGNFFMDELLSLYYEDDESKTTISNFDSWQSPASNKSLRLRGASNGE